MYQKYFELARKEALKSVFSRTRIGCVVVYKNKIISSSYNSDKTHPMQKKYDVYRFDKDTPHKLHAETKAIISIKNKDIDLSKVKIFIYRITKLGFGMARPCKSCMALLKDSGIKHIYYTSDIGFCYEVIQ